MAELTVATNIESLLASWVEAERNGVQFPVPFDVEAEVGFFLAMWAVSKLNALSRKAATGDNKEYGRLFSKVCEIEKWRRDFVMPSKLHHDILIEMCDATNVSIVHSQTIQASKPNDGHVYFLLDTAAGIVKIGWSTDWAGRTKSISAAHPRELNLAKLIAAKSQKDETIFHRRFKKYRVNGEWFKVTGSLKEFLGCTVIEKNEYRDRIIHDDDVINDGSTILKTDLCHRYGILTRNGKPDYPRLKKLLGQLPDQAFQLTARIQDNQELLRHWLPELDRVVQNADRQTWIGE